MKTAEKFIGLKTIYGIHHPDIPFLTMYWGSSTSVYRRNVDHSTISERNLERSAFIRLCKKYNRDPKEFDMMVMDLTPTGISDADLLLLEKYYISNHFTRCNEKWKYYDMPKWELDRANELLELAREKGCRFRYWEEYKESVLISFAELMDLEDSEAAA